MKGFQTGYHKQFYPLKVKRVYTQKFFNHTMWSRHVLSVLEYYGVWELKRVERCGEKSRKGCPDSWWYMYTVIAVRRKSNITAVMMISNTSKNIEKFIQFERTVSSSWDHSIISAWGLSLSSFLFYTNSLLWCIQTWDGF